MDMRALRWFCRVADGETVTTVAHSSFVSQSGVSRALDRLEEDFGVPLLVASGRRVRVTPAGAILQKRARAWLADLDDTRASIHQLGELETGTVHLGFQQSLAAWLLPELLRSFRVLHPAVRFALLQTRDDDHYALSSGPVDLELSTRAWEPHHASVVVVEEPLVVIVPEGHRLSGQHSIRIDQLSGEPVVGLQKVATLRRLTDDLWRNAGLEPQPIFEADDLATVRGLVAGGLGIAIVPAPRIGWPGTSQTGIHHLAIADAGAERQVRLTWHGTNLPPPAAAFRDHVLTRTERGDLPLSRWP